MPNHLGKHKQNLTKHAGFMLPKNDDGNFMKNGHDRPLQLAQIKACEDDVKKNGGAVMFKRGKHAPAPTRAIKSKKEHSAGPRKRLPKCKRNLNKKLSKNKNHNSKALKQAKKNATAPAPIMQDFRVTKPDRAAHALSTDNILNKYSGLNELILKPKPKAQKEEYWDQLPH